MNFPQWPCFAEKTLKDIQAPLLSGQVNYWTGKKGMEFENKFASWIGAEMAISCNSGTSAVNIAVGALNIGPGDEVIVPSYTFIATSFAVLQCGAIPVFCDTTEEHTIDPDKIESLITSRTKAIIVVHLYGVVCDMDPIMAIARKHNLKVIEDSAQCLGGKYKGQSIGTIGDVGTFSFCQSKHFTTGGEGGMVVTNNTEIGWECRAYRDHGFDVRKKFDLLALEEVSWHVHNRIGYNYRMTEIQSIIGINELERFDDWNMKNRQQYAKIYDEKLADIDLIDSLPLNSEDRCNAYWLYPIIFDLSKLDCTAEVILSDLKKIGVPAFKIQWPEAYGEKVFRELRGFGSSNFPFHSTEYTSPESVNYCEVVCETARSLLPRTISLYLHPSWSEEHIVYCAEQLITVLNSHRIG
ncbi:DegT/DnrJ/EryC1/StrS family aminotransferase [Xenorhabdus sp. Vera]|uniref:DegT/DnrJ/EryC1/StrS family aminotransferase n=1 Tax=Xenorhabdus koppenhoeferi TaxID=351659 RepID=UPI0019BBDB99|nr:DegT/DnrJ/EryC1/StrS family aminotransferase [Xenorhabdus sp. Vera]MBD2810577.1 DegT/DnrJ/EryC1/StrS family aminotransferase [Xenorhabdus sp. Vera]